MMSTTEGNLSWQMKVRSREKDDIRNEKFTPFK